MSLPSSIRPPGGRRLRIAVVGAGIAGLSAAWLLRDHAELTLFEAEARAGGHADTQSVAPDGVPIAVDTGFIVYNTLNYPHLTGFFTALGVATQASEMSFGVSVADGALEYGGGELHQLFAQRRNLVRPKFWGMLRDIMRFYREAPGLLDGTGQDALGEESLGDWLARRGYGTAFIEHHILPMGAAIWSGSVAGMRDFPVRHFVRFFHNHGLLRVTNRPAWRTVTGGSKTYVARVLAALEGRVKLGCGVHTVGRTETGVRLHLADGTSQEFDQVILACHAEQALALLPGADPEQQAVLGAITCQDNIAVLHSDTALMPRRRAAWSAWNYLSNGAADHTARVSITYWMNQLQGQNTARPLLVSLNPLRAPDAKLVWATRSYRHPQFDAAAMRAQAQLPGIQGRDGVWFAGAWTGWGFHEDGIASAVRVAASLGVAAPWSAATAPLGRAA